MKTSGFNWIVNSGMEKQYKSESESESEQLIGRTFLYLNN